MKATRLQPGANQLIVGVSIVDSQMKHQKSFEELKREQDVLRRVMALSSNYLSVYSVDPETGRYYEYNVAEEFSRLGFAKEGKDIYEQAVIDAKQIIHPDDLPGFLQWFTKENIRKQVDEHGATAYHYRLMMPEGLKNVSFRVAKVKESSGEKFIAGIRAWRERRSEKEDESV